MSDLLISKRPQDFENDQEDVNPKRQETWGPSNGTKKTNKPGRKPIDTEPKNKRTAQNRAAQRAFRERKERRLKELEDKIVLLEDEKKSANTEAEFLRLQVEMLMGELAKHRGTSDISDLKLPKGPDAATADPLQQRQLSINSSTKEAKTPLSDISSSYSPLGSDKTNKSSTTMSSDILGKENSQFTFAFPWGRKPSLSGKSPNATSLVMNASNHTSNTITTASNINNNSIPALQSDSSTFGSNRSSPFELQNDDQLLFKSKKKETDFNFGEHFDEGVFCNELNSACGTKACPIPKSISQVSTPAVLDSFKPVAPAPQISDPSNAASLNTITEDSSFFLSNGFDTNYDFQFETFDSTLAFGNGPNFEDIFEEENHETDPIAGLITEDSLYDNFKIQDIGGNSDPVNVNISIDQTSNSSSSNTNSTINVPPHIASRHITQNQSPHSLIEESHINTTSNSNSSTTTPSSFLTPRSGTSSGSSAIKEEDQSEVVPAREKQMMKCSEIWDRITAHPRLTDADIDGLCTELRTKAKCSDKGVVIDMQDFHNVILTRVNNASKN